MVLGRRVTFSSSLHGAAVFTSLLPPTRSSTKNRVCPPELQGPDPPLSAEGCEGEEGGSPLDLAPGGEGAAVAAGGTCLSPACPRLLWEYGNTGAGSSQRPPTPPAGDSGSKGKRLGEPQGPWKWSRAGLAGQDQDVALG